MAGRYDVAPPGNAVSKCRVALTGQDAAKYFEDGDESSHPLTLNTFTIISQVSHMHTLT